jgi:hypothetical protein
MPFASAMEMAFRKTWPRQPIISNFRLIEAILMAT